MHKACIILPNQLFEDHPAIKGASEVFLLEHPRFFTETKFHKQKLVLHRASMQTFYDQIDKRKWNAHYIDCPLEKPDFVFRDIIDKYEPDCIQMCNPVDHQLTHDVTQACRKAKCDLKWLDNPAFLNTRSELEAYFPERDHYSMTSFYIDQRKKREILLDKKGKAMGGKWSLDKENRKPLSDDVEVPGLAKFSQPGIRKAVEYVSKHFANHPGKTDHFMYPVDRAGGLALLDDFLENRLDLFGDYEDAISRRQRVLFHSLLSSSLNIGLLRPDEVLDRAIEYGRKKKVRLNSLEGFVRQILGWREFMRGAYEFLHDRMTGVNTLDCKRKMPRAFYEGTTGILPVDHVIEAVQETAYAHHIERLMILGNFMLLCRIDPDEVYRWFMELFIDAYEWVMAPNVYAMSQYSAGSLITTKPYVSSSNYVRKMSDFPKGQWCETWDGLYWTFLDDYRKRFDANPRMKYSSITLGKLSKEKLKQHREVAAAFFKTFDTK